MGDELPCLARVSVRGHGGDHSSAGDDKAGRAIQKRKKISRLNIRERPVLKLQTLQWLDRLFPRTLAGSCVVLTVVVALVLPVVALALRARNGSDGVLAACIAAGICWVASITALVVAKITTDTQLRLAGVFASMALRTGIPLIAAILLTSTSPTLTRGGVFGATVVFYLLTLMLETVLSVRLVNSTSDMSGVS